MSDTQATQGGTLDPVIVVAAPEHHGLITRVADALQDAEQWVVDEFHKLLAMIEGGDAEAGDAGNVTADDASNAAAASAADAAPAAPASDAAPASSEPQA